MHRKLIFSIIIISVFFSLTIVSAQSEFIRGDANFDGKVDLSDSVFMNEYLFKGGSAPSCMDAADANDDGKVDISDSVYLNNYLFLGSGSPPPAPYPDRGVDPTADDLGCGIEARAAICQESFCDVGIKESAEGPGGDFCACSDSTGDAGFEECYNYRTKSTATIPKFILNPEKSDTDSCVDSQTLREVAIDCEWLSQDILVYIDKNCDDFNGPGQWTDYFCLDNTVQRRRATFDFKCNNGACDVEKQGVEVDILSKLGDDDYCYQKKNKCGEGCTEGEYDCDFSSECSTGLVCLGPVGGAADGCCKDGQVWDTTNFECDDCSPGDPCCDANGGFKPDSAVCDSDIGVTEYACKDGTCLDQDVWKRTKKQYCSGTSAACSGKIEPNNPTRQVDCSASQFCKGSQDWRSTQPVCANAQCTSGACCDTTCGVYGFRPNTYVCSSLHEEGCPWGVDLDDDTGKRDGQQRCPGNGKDCTGQIVWGGWVVKEACSVTNYCNVVDGSSYCKAITCSQKSNCGEDGFIGESFCKNNDVWDKWRIWTCNNAGTKSSSCSSTLEDKEKTSCDPEDVWLDASFCKNDDVYQRGDRYIFECTGASCSNTKVEPIDRLVEDCQNGCETTSPTTAQCKGAPPPATCTDSIKNQDETDRDCGGTKCPKCPNTNSCKINNDCQSNYCNPSTLKCESCTNECTSGATRCSSTNVKQTCGNYDTDTCSEWGGDLTCQYGCSNGQCNPSSIDLTITSLVVQWPTTIPAAGQNITLAFTLMNKGTANSTGVFWKLDTDSSDPDPVNSIGLRIDAGKSVTVFTRIRYASPGTYTAKAIADYQNKIDELNEANNEMTKSISVM